MPLLRRHYSHDRASKLREKDRLFEGLEETERRDHSRKARARGARPCRHFRDGRSLGELAAVVEKLRLHSLVLTIGSLKSIIAKDFWLLSRLGKMLGRCDSSISL
jgi:hypothetical protein